MRFCLLQILRPDIDDVAADGLRRIEGQIEILGDFEGGQVVAHVDRSLVDRVRNRHVHQFAGNKRKDQPQPSH